MDVKTAQNDHLQNALRLLWGHRIAVPHSRQFCFRRLCGHSTLRCWRHLTDRSETFQQNYCTALEPLLSPSPHSCFSYLAFGASHAGDSFSLSLWSTRGYWVPLFTTWDSIAGLGRAPIPENISGRS